MKRTFTTAWILAGILTGCAAPEPVLEQVETRVTEGPSTAPSAPLEAAAPATPLPTASPALQRLQELFTKLGYEGVGIDHEDEATLNGLFQLFSSPAAANRRIKSVYTGVALAYDEKAQSLTVPEPIDPKKALAFIRKMVPRK